MMNKTNEQAKDDSYSVRLPLWILVIMLSPLLYQITIIGYDIGYDLFPVPYQTSSEIMEDLGSEGVMMFRQHDRDNDGHLSIEEFEPLAHRLLEVEDMHNYEKEIEESDEVITIQTYFQPLVLSSMTMDWEGQHFLPGRLDNLHGLKGWKKPWQQWKNFGASDFSCFMPQIDPHMLYTVETSYRIMSENVAASYSSNRYIPPKVGNCSEELLHRLLSMFHPRPFVRSRFIPHGAAGVITGINDRFLNISFRFHAEFQLNEPPYFPFWFTPSQFTGHMLITKDGSSLQHFEIFVPPHRKLNVDMEWLNGRLEDSTEVDIGYLPEMKLRSTRPSVPINYGGIDVRNEFIRTESFKPDKVTWDEAISDERSQLLLSNELYPFKKVEYLNLKDASEKAARENKLVHSILLWGSLDDQSC